MTNNVKDFQTEKIKRTGDDGDDLIICCPECKSDVPRFAPVVKFSEDRRPYIVALVCLSAECNGDTHLDVNQGFIE